MQRKRVSYKNIYLETKKKFDQQSEELRKIREKLAQVEEELTSTDKEAQDYLGYLRRLKADFENFKKRNQKEKERAISLGIEENIKLLLPVMDDLERAVNSVEKSQDLSSLAQGIGLIYAQFKKILQKQGLQEIKAKGEPFDPSFHEAVGTVNFDEYPDNAVVEEMRKGYCLNNRVLRPTMVMVNRRKTGE